MYIEKYTIWCLLRFSTSIRSKTHSSRTQSPVWRVLRVPASRLRRAGRARTTGASPGREGSPWRGVLSESKQHEQSKPGVPQQSPRQRPDTSYEKAERRSPALRAGARAGAAAGPSARASPSRAGEAGREEAGAGGTVRGGTEGCEAERHRRIRGGKLETYRDGRRCRCSPVQPLAAACKAGDVSRRYFSPSRRFANVGVASSNLVSCSRKTKRPRLFRSGAFSLVGSLSEADPVKCLLDLATRVSDFCRRTHCRIVTQRICQVRPTAVESTTAPHASPRLRASSKTTRQCSHGWPAAYCGCGASGGLPASSAAARSACRISASARPMKAFVAAL